MKEETYIKAKAIMDEVEYLRSLKKFDFQPECYHVSFGLSSGSGVSANATDIGRNGMRSLINAYVVIVDGLIAEKLQKLEELQE